MVPYFVQKGSTSYAAIPDQAIEGWSFILTMRLLAFQERPYVAREMERYRYISNTGSPMLTDMIFFDQMRSKIEKCSDFIKVVDSNPPYIVFNPRNIEQNRFLHQLGKFFDYSIQSIDPPERIEIKSHRVNGVQKPRKENVKSEMKISKDDAISLLKDGIPIGEILEAFPNSFTKGQLAAIKAHITMGTYNK